MHPEKVAAALARRRIMVVEDEPLLADELMDALHAIGAEPIGPVMTVAETLRAIWDESVLDAALVNVHLKGGELCLPIVTALRDRDIPFILVTGDEMFVREHFPGGLSYPKPVNMPGLMNAIGELLYPRNG